MVQFEIYNTKTNETIDVETDKYFKNYGVLINLDGDILLVQYGKVICCVNERYGVRIANQN